MAGDEEFEERFKIALAKGRDLTTKHVAPTQSHKGKIANEPFHDWQAQTLDLLQTVFGLDHTFTKNFEIGTTFRGEPEASKSFVESGMGVLTAANENYSRGWTRTYSEMLHAEVFDDFLEMADHLLKNGRYHVAAIVIAGGTLEEHLRKLSVKNTLTVEDSAAKMNDALWKKNVYLKPTWRRIQSWYDLRTDAAHGIQRTYTDAEVADMFRGIGNFIDQYPA